MPVGLPLPIGVQRRPGRPAGIGSVNAERLLTLQPVAEYAEPNTQSGLEAVTAAARVPEGPLVPAAGPARPAPCQPASLASAVADARTPGDPHRPSLLVLANTPLTDGRVLLGSSPTYTLTDSADSSRVQAVLEFHGYGLCLLDIAGEGFAELWVAEPGGKVAVQTAPTHITVINLDDQRSPLVALLATDARRTTRHTTLSDRLGPALVGTYTPNQQAVLHLNSAYVNRPGCDAGVRVEPPPTAAERSVVIPLRLQLELGAHLYQQIFENPDVVRAFGRLNIRVLPAPGGVELGPAPGEKADLRDRRPLLSAMAPGQKLNRRLFG